MPGFEMYLSGYTQGILEQTLNLCAIDWFGQSIDEILC